MNKKMKWGGMLVASLLMASGCQNEEIIETPSAGGQRISLTVGREGGSRTALEGDQAVWSKGDKIYVSSKDGKTTGVLTLQGEGGDATGTFSGFVFGNPANLAYSVYPAPTNGTTIDLANILASGQLNAPMIGTINQNADVDVQFRNQCGILYINMNGSEGGNFQITANDIDIAADNTKTVNVLQFAGTFDVKNISWASDGTPSLIFDNPTSFINVKNTNVAGSNSSVMYVPYYITTTNVALDKVTFMAGGTPMNDEPINFTEAENGFVGSVAKNSINELKSIAKIGDVVYASLQGAVNAVEDGETIALVADETFTEQNRYNNGGYWDGLGYSGDKSFTIDLGGKTISQDGALNDYLMWFKNDGSKDNTITLKNGTLDAGTTAYCALATSSSNAQKITINLEDINLINNKSDGAVVKARGGSELNVKAGTIITGKNSYVGIEAVGDNTVVNIYDGAEIYQNGTSSNVGAIVGASYNATMNIYGGYGKSAKCGIIVMSTGATINVSGGEWIANGNGTVASDNNAVLVSQNNRNESGWACKSVLNVTGGTFKGGYNCYGMGPSVEADDAQINIKGGNFNADPTQYMVAGYEVTGNYTVAKPQALVELESAIDKGGNVTLTNDVTLLESLEITNKLVLDLNGKTITAPLFSAFEVKAGGELTIKNGKVVAYGSTVRAIGGKATIESGEYTSTGTAVGSTPATYRYSLDCREGGELVINGGTFKSNNGMINVGSTVTINGGKFENIVEKSMTRHFAYVSALLTINDGEFYGKANSSAGGYFFCGAAASGDIQIKGGKFTSLWTSGSVNGIFGSHNGGTINVTGGMFNTNGGIATFVTENTDEATKAAYPYVAK